MSQVLIPFDRLKSKGIVYSKVHLWRMERAGKFPQRVHVSPARVAWIETEVDAWIQSRIDARQQVAA